MTQKLDGPRVAAKSGTARQIVVFLHGYGADGKDLIEIGRQWQAWLPDAAFVAPHAPEPCGMSPMGRQWFALTNRAPDERWTGVNAAAPALDAFLDAELAQHGLPAAKMALVGFSQGTMMALHVGLRRKQQLASILGFSGMLVGPEHLGEARQLQTPVLLTHGDQDQVIPVDAMFNAAEDIAKAGGAAQWHLAPGVAHGIDNGGLRHGGLFLAKNFGVVVRK